MRGLHLLRRRIDEVAAQLADVLEQRAALLAHVAPEIRGREPRRESPRRRRRTKVAPRRDHAADAVIERQTVEHAIVGRVSNKPANQWLHCMTR